MIRSEGSTAVDPTSPFHLRGIASTGVLRQLNSGSSMKWGNTEVHVAVSELREKTLAEVE